MELGLFEMTAHPPERGMFEALVGTKSRLSYSGKIAEDPVFLNQFAQMDAEYRAVRTHVLNTFQTIEDRVRRGEPVNLYDFASARQVATWSHQRAGEIVGFAFRWAGTTPVRNPNALGRCMRDTLVANAHLLFDPKTLTDAGLELLKRWVK